MSVIDEWLFDRNPVVAAIRIVDVKELACNQ